MVYVVFFRDGKRRPEIVAICSTRRKALVICLQLEEQDAGFIGAPLDDGPFPSDISSAVYPNRKPTRNGA